LIKVLVVDDSPFIRVALRKLLSSEGDIKVVGEASNGKEAVNKVKELKPDVVTLDVNMPIMDGLSALEEIKKECPECRVLMISALTKEGARETIEALSRGAVDFITKPEDYRELIAFKEEIVSKVRAAFEAKRKPTGGYTRSVLSDKRISFSRPPLVAIGISTGGPQTLNAVLPRIPSNFPSPLIIAIHMPDTFTSTFARHLNGLCSLPVKEAEEGETIKGGRVYVSRGRIHITLSGSPKKPVVKYIKDENYIYKPSADLLFSSVARIFGSNSVAVVMTGMGNDGSKGICDIMRVGGMTVAEDPRTAILWAMPQSAINSGCVRYVVKKEELPDLLTKLVGVAQSR